MCIVTLVLNFQLQQKRHVGKLWPYTFSFVIPKNAEVEGNVEQNSISLEQLHIKLKYVLLHSFLGASYFFAE